VVDLIAATLHRVAEQATRVAGAPPTQVHLVVPADWGPRRNTLIRHAAHRAGLPEPALIPAPVALAQHLHDTGTPLPVGTPLAVCDFGAGFHASIITHTPTGWQVVSDISAEHAGGDHLDQLLAEHVLTLTRTTTPPEPHTDPTTDPTTERGAAPAVAGGAWWAGRGGR
jgi:molecular chaperone DnaK (HSP70)